MWAELPREEEIRNAVIHQIKRMGDPSVSMIRRALKRRDYTQDEILEVLVDLHDAKTIKFIPAKSEVRLGSPCDRFRYVG